MARSPLAPQPAPHETGRSRQRAWVVVDTDAITANARSIRRLIGPQTQLMAVVKADGYGHGAVAVAQAAQEGGASCFGVATLAEGVELRRAGLRAPVLVRAPAGFGKTTALLPLAMERTTA